MNLNQLLYVITQSLLKVKDIEKTYGYTCTNDLKDLYLLIIGYDILRNSDWYSLPEEDYNSILYQVNLIIRNNRFSIFNTPTNDIYSNTGDPQTSFTFDQILL